MPIKPPRTAKHAITELHKLTEYLKYYMGTKNFRKEVAESAVYIEDTLYELAVDKKIDHIRLAKKLKNIWGRKKE